MNKYQKLGMTFAGGLLCGGVLTTITAIKFVGKAVISEAILSAVRHEEKITYAHPYHSRRRYVSYGDANGWFEKDILFESQTEAEYVLNALEKIIADYGAATVSNFYDLCGLAAPDFRSTSEGWMNLNRTRIVRRRGGYILDLPHPVTLPK